MEEDYQSNQHQISSEKLAYWYLRLNGFLTTVNFVVHPDIGREQRTDVDVLGCRFPHRSELFDNPMIDEEVFTQISDKVFIAVAEVKSGRCKLNGPWTEPERSNMQRVLRAIGAFPDNDVNQIAVYLYDNGCYENQATHISIMCFGSHVNIDLKKRYPAVPQITWGNILSFIYTRFRIYREQKSAHVQWDECGKLLWDLAIDCNNPDEFLNRLIIVYSMILNKINTIISYK